MLSRVAESIYWMCRYIERAENVARIVNVNWNLTLDASSSEPQWQPLISIMGDEEYFAEHYESATQDNVMRFLACDRDYPNSIYNCLRNARENARSIREIIPSDVWEQVNKFYQEVESATQGGSIMESPHEFLGMVVRGSNEFIGRSYTTMMHDEGWHFSRLARMLERSDKTSRILDVKYFYLLPTVEDVGSSLDNIQWSALLRSASALQAYRQIYGPIDPQNVVELLLLGYGFPRSVKYCVDRLQTSLAFVSGSPPGLYTNDAERCCDRLRSQLNCARVEDIIQSGLHEFVDSLQVQLNEIGCAIQKQFFDRREIETPEVAVEAPELDIEYPGGKAAAADRHAVASQMQ
ncbi:MAG: alpha-E domain-containing protein [Candidatus Hydrogenedentes bacterium]|nr:alpha-E domain-containing protein [Candidatus Hydrogenedentota bacterium]